MIRPVSHRLLLRYGVLAAAAALVCTSCSGSGGNAAQSLASAAASTSAAASSSAAPSADPLDAAAIKAAMKKATAVHAKGSDGGTTFDMQINRDSVSGSIEKDGAVVPLVRVGDKVWIKFTRGMAKISGRPAGARSPLDDKWVSMDSPMTQGFGEELKLFLDFDVFVSGMASEIDQPGFGTGQPADVAGTFALRYENDSTTVFIEAVEPHRVLRLESPKQGTMEFSGWDQPVPVQAPPAAEIYSGPGS
ncbi:hypothetical protein ATK30_6979 [Amycolatopsis echigonensis]|uniref:Lipoprotein LprG n=1 Tax=Amycolatopsis echigonensis TaxID=2576905 RepID=A0A2N3WQC4_9PSEU|nr:hypothetical protein [Amycolatopsis niigatensis]PKV96043.1 hypothetical protein ATK30_6979 [Amycolatopsis niigatensis]